FPPFSNAALVPFMPPALTGFFIIFLAAAIVFFSVCCDRRSGNEREPVFGERRRAVPLRDPRFVATFSGGFNPLVPKKPGNSREKRDFLGPWRGSWPPMHKPDEGCHATVRFGMIIAGHLAVQEEPRRDGKPRRRLRLAEGWLRLEGPRIAAMAPGPCPHTPDLGGPGALVF